MKISKIIIGIIVLAVVVWGGVKLFGTKEEKTKETIKIGIILPLSGNASALGESAKNAAILAKEQFKNTKNEYELIFEDDQADSKKTVSAFRKLVDVNKVRAVVTAFSGPGNAIAPIAQKEKIIHFSIGSADITIPKDKEYVFSHWLKPENEAEIYVKEAKKQGLNKIAIIASNQEGLVARRDALLKTDSSIFLLKDTLVDQKEKDFRTTLLKAKKEGADALVFLTLPGQLTPSIKQSKDLGMNVPLTSVGSFEHEKDAVSLLEGQWYVNPANPSDEFTTKFKEKYGSLPLLGSGNFYDVVNILVLSFDGDKGKKNEDVIKSISMIKDFSGAMGNLSMDSEGAIDGNAVVKKVINGEFVEVK